MKKKLALLGGEPVFSEKDADLLKNISKWPIITEEDEAAALDVIRNNKYSDIDITEKFEEEFRNWLGTNHALAFCNGTMALAAAMYAAGLGKGDEIICPTITYWASVAAATTFGATAVFCNIDERRCLDPDDLERVISPNTKAIMVVHYASQPADMDRIMPIAKKHNLVVIEDVSHAQGGFYKGRRLGTIGDIGAMSLMSTKSFAAGELGMLVTNERKYYERAIAYGHYDRNSEKYITETEELFPYFGMPLGGLKGRVNQLCAAIGRVQLKYYDERCAEIKKAMDFFWNEIKGLPGFEPIRADIFENSTNAGYYAVSAIYKPEELHGLDAKTFVKAIKAEIGIGEGCRYNMGGGSNSCLHTHNFFKTFDFVKSGEPSRIYGQARDVRELDKVLDSALEKQKNTILGPWFKKYDEKALKMVAQAFKNVVENHEQLLNAKEDKTTGRWFGID